MGKMFIKSKAGDKQLRKLFLKGKSEESIASEQKQVANGLQ